VNGGEATRLTNSGGIDTEPTFSPDGKWIGFVSDRGGSPQVYRMSAAGGEAQRLTFNGSYNVSPDWSPDGKSITFIQRDGGKFQVALLELDTGQNQVLTDSSLDEKPSFAPNGKLILYATQVKGRGVLAVVSSDGQVKYRLNAGASGDIREPAWGPFPKN
jgi:TolB protein